MDINVCSLCHVRNVVPCISWSSNDSWHFPICFHGVGWDFFTQKITNNLYISKFLFAPVKFEMKKFECIIYFLLELYSELFFKLKNRSFFGGGGVINSLISKVCICVNISVCLDDNIWYEYLIYCCFFKKKKLFSSFGFYKLRLTFVYWLISVNQSLSFYRVFAGFVSGRIYKTMKGQQWKKAAFQARFYNNFFLNCSFAHDNL